MDFISSQVAQYPDLAEKYEELGRFSQQRLWHELTIALLAFLENKSNRRGNNFIELFHNFIAPNELKLSSVKLTMLITITSSCYESLDDSLNFLLSKLNGKSKLDETCTICVELDIAMVRIKLGQHREAKDIIDRATVNVSTKNVERIVFSKYYNALSRYYLATQGPTEKFYRNSLTLLSYTPMEELMEEDRLHLATDMAIAAITGKDIFNFGEVIATPILKYLRNTPNDWLESLIMALNDGEVAIFNKIISTCQDKFQQNPYLMSRLSEIQLKVVILCVMNIAFERTSHERKLTFQEISARTQVSVDQVEWILMQAMALGQIRGVIDEVAQNIQISWVKPRVLNMQNISHMQQQLEKWSKNVHSTLRDVEENTAELLL